MEFLLYKDAITELISPYINEKLTVLDIGCSGGVDPGWSSFGEQVKVFGFDPVVDNINQLVRINKNQNVRYIEAFIEGVGDFPPPLLQFWQRLSCYVTQQIRNKKSWKESFTSALARNEWDQLLLTENKINIVDFLSEEQIEPNFIKIDVDGDDLKILTSLEEHLVKDDFLGVCIEVNYNGSSAANENTFHNVDRFLRKCGFDLYDLSVRKYSMAALPAPYALSIPAQSIKGRPLQGDALYFKDHVSKSQRGEKTPTTNTLLKLACLFSVFDHKDSCADLLIHFNSSFPKELRMNKLLDEIVKHSGIENFKGLTHSQVQKQFIKDTHIFYP